MFLHDIIDGFKFIDVHVRALCAKPQNPVYFLLVEVLRLRLNTAERVLEHAASIVLIFAEKERIFDKVAFIFASLCVALVKSTSVHACAFAIYFFAVEELEHVTLRRIIKTVDMLATMACRA